MQLTTERFLSELKRLTQEWLIEKSIPDPLMPVLKLIKKEIVIMLTYKLGLPAATAPDVVKWEMGTTVGANPEAIAVATDGMTVQFNAGDVVSLRLRETDADNNVSDWGTPFAFTAADTLPPSAPGAPTLTEVADS